MKEGETMLFISATTDNLVVDEPLHKSYSIEPVTTTYTRERYDPTLSSSVRQEQQVTQFRAIASLQGSYRYVGMTYDAAMSTTSSLVEAYSHNVDKYNVQLSSDEDTGEWRYQYFPTNNVPMQGADITPRHVDGTMWEVNVDVNATVEHYYTTMPSALTTVLDLVNDFISSDPNLSAI